MTGRRAVHERTGKVLAEELEVANSMVALTAGLMFRKTLEPGHGMWLNPCNGIHMMFMNFPIDAVFLDSEERVRKVYRKLPQWYGVVGVVLGSRNVPSLTELGRQEQDRLPVVCMGRAQCPRAAPGLHRGHRPAARRPDRDHVNEVVNAHSRL
ncbi:MAG: hypothetical protein NVS9B11_03330 [Candidatus Dormibacteraceae bacterium]